MTAAMYSFMVGMIINVSLTLESQIQILRNLRLQLTIVLFLFHNKENNV